MVMLKETWTNSYDLARTLVLVLTEGICGLAKEINRSLLEKVRLLLSNTRLDKSFWAEAIVYASHLINGSTTIGGKTLLEI